MIEGLFLSSGIIRDEDYTMEEIARVARELRQTHGFRGYIHLKAIAGADPRLIEEAGRHADRLSINTELVADASLKRLAPEKDAGVIRRAMAGVRLKLEEAKPERGARAKPPRFAPAGQSTQIIVGADADDRSARSCCAAPICIRATVCGASIIPHSARYPRPPPRCR